MTLQPCRECGAQISTQAMACPHCGVPATIVAAKRKKSGLLWWMTWAVIAVFVIFGRLMPEKPRLRLDYSKPIYTGEYTEVCSISLLYGNRTDHDMLAVEDAFESTFSRSSKFKALGCEEWHSGIRLYVREIDNAFGDYVEVGLSPNSFPMFTKAFELTNHP